MKSNSVAIVKSDFHGKHSGSWTGEWLRVCKEKSIKHELVDWREEGAFENLRKHSVVLWHYSHYSSDEMRFAPSILESLRESGCEVFPGNADSRHFDDKIIQAYLLKGLGLLTPENYPLHSLAAVDDWLEKNGTFPVVGKLRSGSGANNVRLLKNERQLRRYSRRMFKKGLSARPAVMLKAKSNLFSSRSMADFFARLKRIPEFLFSRKLASGRGRERGYVYLQEFIKGASYDLKVVVIGGKLSFIGRKVRKGDFRASGGGDLFYDRTLVTPDVISAAFKAAEALNSDCAGFDMVVDPENGQPLILEVSYGFSYQALLQAGGYYDKDMRWHGRPLNAPEAVLNRMIEKAGL